MSFPSQKEQGNMNMIFSVTRAIRLQVLYPYLHCIFAVQVLLIDTNPHTHTQTHSHFHLSATHKLSVNIIYSLYYIYILSFSWIHVLSVSCYFFGVFFFWSDPSHIHKDGASMLAVTTHSVFINSHDCYKPDYSPSTGLCALEEV